MAYRTREDAEAWAMSLRDSKRDPDTGDIWARCPISRAIGKLYVTPCIAFTKSGKRVKAYTAMIGA